MSGTTLLVDAPSLIYRAFFSTPETVRAPDGVPVNAAHGFLGMLTRLISDHDPARVGCAADEDWRPQWRVDLIDSYKAHRTLATSIQQQVDEQITAQVRVTYRLLELCGVKVVGCPGYEAEDVIGTLAARTTGRVAIVSGDRDLFQLVRDPDVVVLFPRRGTSVVDRVDERYIESRFGIPGRAYRDYAVLRGDASDGLPGVRGIGEKMAASLVRRYGSLEGVVAAATTGPSSVPLGRVRRDLDYIDRAVRVVSISTDAPVPSVDLTRPRGVRPASIDDVAKRSGLTGAVERLLAALRGSQG
jgi:5'-3' exonuclease